MYSTIGVLPLPPTRSFPTLTTGRSSWRRRDGSRAYQARRHAAAAPYAWLSVPTPKLVTKFPGGASRLAALLLAHVCPICSLVAPCDPGAAPGTLATNVGVGTLVSGSMHEAEGTDHGSALAVAAVAVRQQLGDDRERSRLS